MTKEFQIFHKAFRRIGLSLLLIILFAGIKLTCTPLNGQTGPQPGEIFREYIITMNKNDLWRVTDPNASNSGAKAFLPNPLLSLSISDLSLAVRAEATIEVWGGHVGTTGKKFRFNENEWINIPSVPGISEQPDCYLSEYNVCVNVPLNHLKEGINIIEGTSGGQLCYDFGWGQWGWYVMVLRVYYSNEKPHREGSIIHPQSKTNLTENPLIRLMTEDSASTKQIRIIGKYFGFDENGDGIFYDWHQAFHKGNMEGHIATLVPENSFCTHWDTEWIPDPSSFGISLMAMIEDTSGMWYVCPVIDSLSLIRTNYPRVRMYKASNIPKGFSVRNNKNKQCTIPIDSLTTASEALFIHRSWNGGDDGDAGGTILQPLRINQRSYKCFGKNHAFAQSIIRVPLTDLKTGSNTIEYMSDTEHHGIEVLWPGPAIFIKYNPEAPKISAPVFTPSGNDTYTFPFTTEITSETEGTEFYYTTTGKDPNPSDMPYYAPLVIRKPVMVKVRGFKAGYKTSEVSSANFILKNDIPELSSKKTFSLFPNPCRGFLNISLPEGENLQYLECFAGNGKLLKTYFTSQTFIYTGFLEQGMYMFRASTNKNIYYDWVFYRE